GAATTTTESIPAPEGTLRFVEFSPVTTFNPAGAQTAQSAYLYPHYDTLTRQNADLSLAPGLATSWTQPESTVWEFTLRDDVVFHDGSAFNAQVAADNLDYHASFEGNPNGGTWAAYVATTVVDDSTIQVEFSVPAPQFPLEMSMVMGMMISPNAIAEDADLTRNPQGSGPWIWSDSDSQAGATEVFNLNENYWNPADQGVETVTVTAVPDNNARMNALLTDEADIMATTRDAQIQTGLDGGNTLISVPNYFPYILIQGRAGETDEALADVRVRQAILYAVDLDAYSDAIHAGLSDAQSGIYPSAFSQFHVPELTDKYSYDPAKAKALLEEAGYGDGVTITMPIMPAINPHVELVIQMLGAVGISVNQVQINNGELGPRTAAAEWDISWFRDLLVHPARDLGKFTSATGRWNPHANPDVEPLDAKLQEALNETDTEAARALYAEVMEGLIDLGVVIPLGHGGQNGMYAPHVTGVTLGLNMQAPMPYGVRVDG
ncbi:MAG: ABC transporter substrate-binding protein, partial [Actinomycetota bacterium]|nr:ABC transporter substrate-binding protein [Actinomycetota bacterium]